ncbi:MAG: glucosamine-6-phosphate deaminase [Chloroflexi bacterium]|nr:glucosamine-6-phosphate deaminase [Chloroflexota bacterium]
MNVKVFASQEEADAAAGDCLAGWLVSPATRNVMVAGGNTPLALYRNIAARGLKLPHAQVFALDEYVGVPLDEPRNCANLLRRSVAEAWGIPPARFFSMSSLAVEAGASVREHERRIQQSGGLDVIVLGLGQNGHLGFNEPGSARDTAARVLDLDPLSIEANRRWFDGQHAPAKGVTMGLKTILSARHVLILAYGAHKASAVKAMIEGPPGEYCPASFLQEHPDAHLFVDERAAASLSRVYSTDPNPHPGPLPFPKGEGESQPTLGNSHGTVTVQEPQERTPSPHRTCLPCRHRQVGRGMG